MDNDILTCIWIIMYMLVVQRSVTLIRFLRYITYHFLSCQSVFLQIVCLFHLHCMLFCALLPAIALLHSSERNGQRNCAQGQWSAYASTLQSNHRMQKVGFVVFLAFLRFFKSIFFVFFQVQVHKLYAHT